ncbi:hypothetical protein ACHAPJ_006157 [Fusarium lateritium]
MKTIFGYPRGAIPPVFDAIYNSKHFDFILPEQGAGHMTEGYAPFWQEADVVGISRACTKWNVMRPSQSRPGRSSQGRHCWCPKKSIPTETALPSLPSAASCAAMDLSKKQLESAPKCVGNLVKKAKKPIIYTGQGIALSKGGLEFLKELVADLIIALGAQFDNPVTASIAKFAFGAKAAAGEGGGIVHFEIMPKNINKVIQATEAIEGDVATNLKELLPFVDSKSTEDRKEWFGKIKEWRKNALSARTLIEELSELVEDHKDKTYIATGVGQYQIHPRSIITSGGQGTLCYGLPAAIGAKVAQPDALVSDIDGDASLNVTLTELSTAAQFKIGVKVIILSSEEQGMVPKPDDDALKCLVNTDGPALLEVITDKKVPILPMVPVGSGLHAFLVFDEAKDKKRRELMRERTCGLHG